MDNQQHHCCVEDFCCDPSLLLKLDSNVGDVTGLLESDFLRFLIGLSYFEHLSAGVKKSAFLTQMLIDNSWGIVAKSLHQGAGPKIFRFHHVRVGLYQVLKVQTHLPAPQKDVVIEDTEHPH